MTIASAAALRRGGRGGAAHGCAPGSEEQALPADYQAIDDLFLEGV
jgi:hypothetical protein